MTDDDDITKLTFEELYDTYTKANSSKHIVTYFNLLCKKLNIDLDRYYANRRLATKSPVGPQRLLYQLIQSRTDYWKSTTLWKLYDKKLAHKDYNLVKANKNVPLTTRKSILIIGSGPVGLRLSIELALLGLNVVVVEKRDRFSRNNVLHLWPYTIVDLRNLGAKQFYGKFCAGSIDHISWFLSGIST